MSLTLPGVSMSLHKWVNDPHFLRVMETPNLIDVGRGANNYLRAAAPVPPTPGALGFGFFGFFWVKC